MTFKGKVIRLVITLKNIGNSMLLEYKPTAVFDNRQCEKQFNSAFDSKRNISLCETFHFKVM